MILVMCSVSTVMVSKLAQLTQYQLHYSNTCFTIHFIENKITVNIADGHRKITVKGLISYGNLSTKKLTKL